MRAFQNKVIDFSRKCAKEKDPNKDSGFWVFCPDLVIKSIEHFHKAMVPICLYYKFYYAVKCNLCPYIVKTVLEKHNKEKEWI